MDSLFLDKLRKRRVKRSDFGALKFKQFEFKELEFFGSSFIPRSNSRRKSTYRPKCTSRPRCTSRRCPSLKLPKRFQANRTPPAPMFNRIHLLFAFRCIFKTLSSSLFTICIQKKGSLHSARIKRRHFYFPVFWSV